MTVSYVAALKRLLTPLPPCSAACCHRGFLTTRYATLSVILALHAQVYAIPCDADAVLRIDPDTDSVTTFGGPLPPGKEKWEGGVVGNDGVMYCMPQQCRYALKIDPAYERRGDGNQYTSV